MRQPENKWHFVSNLFSTMNKISTDVSLFFFSFEFSVFVFRSFDFDASSVRLFFFFFSFIRLVSFDIFTSARSRFSFSFFVRRVARLWFASFAVRFSFPPFWLNFVARFMASLILFRYIRSATPLRALYKVNTNIVVSVAEKMLLFRSRGGRFSVRVALGFACVAVSPLNRCLRPSLKRV